MFLATHEFEPFFGAEEMAEGDDFELTNVHGKPTAGILKDVVLVKGFKKIEVDVTPVMDGLTLFHCHQQLHMDYGFKLLLNVV